MNLDWNIIGHDKIVKFFKNEINLHRLSHAYLFYGNKHLGKSSLVYEIVRSLFCKQEVVPCKECIFCKQIQKNIFPDVYWLDCNENKKNISIEQIRNLRKNLNKKSFSGLYKIAIIKNADKLSRSAGNSLLKILEEPPCKTYFFLLTNNMYNILETVKSRCQLIHFFIVPQDKIAKYLINEKGLIDKKAKRLAFLSRGHPGLAVDYYEDETALKNFEDKMDQCIYFIENDLDAKFAFIETLTSKKNHKGTANEINIFLNNLIIVIRDILMLRLIGDPVKQYDVYLNKKLKKIINKYDISKMLTLINLLQRTKSNIIFNGNVKLNLEYIALAL